VLSCTFIDSELQYYRKIKQQAFITKSQALREQTTTNRAVLTVASAFKKRSLFYDMDAILQAFQRLSLGSLRLMT
jgi:hypothetical protein